MFAKLVLSAALLFSLHLSTARADDACSLLSKEDRVQFAIPAEASGVLEQREGKRACVYKIGSAISSMLAFGKVTTKESRKFEAFLEQVRAESASPKDGHTGGSTATGNSSFCTTNTAEGTLVIVCSGIKEGLALTITTTSPASSEQENLSAVSVLRGFENVLSKLLENGANNAFNLDVQKRSSLLHAG